MNIVMFTEIDLASIVDFAMRMKSVPQTDDANA